MMKKIISSIESHYFLGGLIAFYLFALFFIFDINIEALRNSELSEVASFITGVFTPITFLILIYQYSSQQKEINRIANKQEFEEIRNQIAIQPNIYFESFSLKRIYDGEYDEEYFKFDLIIKNSARKVINVDCQLASEKFILEKKQSLQS